MLGKVDVYLPTHAFLMDNSMSPHQRRDLKCLLMKMGHQLPKLEILEQVVDHVIMSTHGFIYAYIVAYPEADLGICRSLGTSQGN